MAQPYRAYPAKGTGLTLAARCGALMSSRLRAGLAFARVAPRSGCPTSRFRRARFVLLRGPDAGLGAVDGDPRPPFRGMNAPQRPELPFLRSAQRRLVGAPRARVVAPSEQRQHGKRDRNGQGNHARRIAQIEPRGSLKRAYKIRCE